MKVRIWKGVRRIERGLEVHACGTVIDFARDHKIDVHFEVPVAWGTQRASMQYFGEGAYVPFNYIATRLLGHPHLKIRGTVYLIKHVEKRFKMRAWGSHEEVMSAIANVGLSVPPIVVNLGTFIPQQDIYAATQDDLFAIRMCL